MVGVEPPDDGLPHDLQRHPPGFGLDRLKVIECAVADQARGLGGDLVADFRRDRRDDIFFGDYIRVYPKGDPRGGRAMAEVNNGQIIVCSAFLSSAPIRPQFRGDQHRPRGSR